MPTSRFIASVQYNDWRGTSAADSADQQSPESWLEDNGHKDEDEFLIGIKVYAGENHGTHEDPVFVEFLLIASEGYDDAHAKIEAATGPIEVKRVSVDMSIAEFLALFKRFEVALSRDERFNGSEYSHD